MGFFFITFRKWHQMVGKIMHTARILSIDVVAGACICTLFIAQYLKIKLPFSCVLALGICVWLIYTADHLIDAWKIKHLAHSPRHSFHQRHFKTITGIFLLLGLCSISFLWLLPVIVVQWGILLVIFVSAYFLLMNFLKPSLFFQKELVAAILYASGVFLAPVSLSGQPITAALTLIFMQFFLIAFINLIVFSLFEKDLDETDGHFSFVRLAGVKATRQLLTGLALLAVISTLACMFYFPIKSCMFKAEALLSGMSLTLLGIVSKPSAFERHEIYRVIGDGIFFYPLVLLLF